MKTIKKALAIVVLSSMSAGLALDVRSVTNSAKIAINQAKTKASQAGTWVAASGRSAYDAAAGKVSHVSDVARTGIVAGYANAKDACVYAGHAGYDKVTQTLSLAQIKAAAVAHVVTAFACHYRKELAVAGLLSATGLGYAGYRYYQTKKAQADMDEAEVAGK